MQKNDTLEEAVERECFDIKSETLTEELFFA
jgi:hypothetical protein